MHDKLKVGVIGLGMGSYHLKELLALPTVTVAAICDVDAARLAKFKQDFSIPQAFTNAETMFTQTPLDAVVIATPNKFHAPLTIRALELGQHVLCEKPMAMNTAEAEQMQRAAEKAGKRLMINLSFRFTPAAFALKRQVEMDVLGKIYFARTVWHRRHGIPNFGSWFTTKALSGGGPLIDLGVHRIDLALWLMGNPNVKTISAMSYNHLGQKLAQAKGKVYDVEDLAVAFLRLENDASLSVEISWALHRHEREHMETRLYGTRGGAVHQNENESYHFVAKVFTEEGGFFTDKIFSDDPTPVPSGPRHFIDCILNDQEPLASGLDGLRLMRILDGIYRSAALKQEIHL